MKGILDDGFREPLIESPDDYIGMEETRSSAPYATNHRQEDEDEEGSVVSDIGTEDVGTAYDDFQTVDWLRDQAKDRQRHKTTLTQSVWYRIGDALSGWAVVFIIGILSGLVAGVVEIGSKWMIDVREGHCGERWFLDKEACCWSNSTIIAQDYCSNWIRWSDLMASGDNTVVSYIVNYFFYILIGTFFALLTVIFVMVIAPYASGSGIPEVKTILSGFIIRGYLGLSTLITKSVGLVLCVASGLSLGKEGPMVHVSCCIGNVFVRLFPKFGRNEARKREVLSAAAAAGVSVAFGAPLGGVLFSLEEVSYYFPHKTLWRSFFCAMVASVVLQSLNPYSTGQSALFYIDYDYTWHFFELIPFVILGCIGGVLGAIFIKANVYWCMKRKTTRLGHHPVLEVAVVALVTALISFVNPFTRKSTAGLIKELFSVCEWEDNSDLCDYNFTQRFTTNNGTIQASNIAWGPPAARLKRALWELVMAAVVKSVLTVFTFGLKVPAGLFIPSLAVGGCIGRVMGEAVQYITYLNRDSAFLTGICPDMSVCTLTGLYAMVGAAAVLSGVTRMTVSLVVIMFELTGGITYIVPIMVAVMTAKWVGDFITPGGIYDAHITINGYPYLEGKERFMHTSTCEDVCRRNKELKTINASCATVQDLTILLEMTTYQGFPIVADNELNIVTGYVSRKDLVRAMKCAREKHVDLVNASRVFFTDTLLRSGGGVGGPISVSLGRFVNHDPICIEPKTPLAQTIDMFTKLGLSQLLVTHRGKLRGIITRKDVLRHIDNLKATCNSHDLF